MKRILIALLLMLLLTGCGRQEAAPQGPDWNTLEKTGSMPLEYAAEFSVDYYTGGYARISVTDGNTYVLVPEGMGVPKNLENVTVIHQNPKAIYMAATSAMDLYRAFDGIGSIRLSSLEESGWYVEEAKAAMAAGEMLYAGKYSAPDYERIYQEKCDLAVESTMIYHTPEVKEQLERLGVPVFVERSSYEKHPLGRMEWIKLHGLLLGKAEQAEAVFSRESQAVQTILGQENTGKTVAFFAINSNGTVTVRKTGDYIAKSIALAGGNYIFTDLGDDSSTMSTVVLQMEAFYDTAKDADVLIYNSTLNGEIHTIQELLTQSSLLKDFKAVQSGNVWCTGRNLFQEGMSVGGMILEMHQIFTDENDGSFRYLHRLT